MTALSLMESPLWLAAGWTMLHFLWAGAAVGLVGALGRRYLRAARPEIRYAWALACWAALALAPLMLLPLASKQAASSTPHVADLAVTGGVQMGPDPLECGDSSPLFPGPKSGDSSPHSKLGPDPVDVFPPSPSPPTDPPRPLFLTALSILVSWLPWVWLIGTPMTFALAATGLSGAARLRRHCRRLSDGPIAGLCWRLATELKVAGTVGVAVCERAAVPLLLGIVRPLILLPPAALTGWTPEQLKMVLLHELAHVRRHDNLVNLIQRLIEAVLFFHPAVWWVSAWIRLERECCCDQAVLAHGARPLAYAQTLAHLALIEPPGAGAAMARGSLAVRIRRILNLEDRSMKVSRLAVALVAALFLVPVILLGASAEDRAVILFADDQAPPAEPASQAPPEAPPRISRPADQAGPLTTKSAPIPSVAKDQAPIQVDVVRPVMRTVARSMDFTGRIEPASSVEVRAQISGPLTRVAFQDGARVKKGDLLFEIDSRVNQVELEKAEAALAQSEARLKRAALDLNRAKTLLPQGTIPQGDFDKISGDRAEAEANVRLARAAVEAARLTLQFTRVTAPINGRIGRRLLDPGSLVNAGTTLLAAIIADNPLYATFHISEASLLHLGKEVNEGKVKDLDRVVQGLAGKAGGFMPNLCRPSPEPPGGPCQSRRWERSFPSDLSKREISWRTPTVRE